MRLRIKCDLWALCASLRRLICTVQRKIQQIGFACSIFILADLLIKYCSFSFKTYENRSRFNILTKTMQMKFISYVQVMFYKVIELRSRRSIVTFLKSFFYGHWTEFFFSNRHTSCFLVYHGRFK